MIFLNVAPPKQIEKKDTLVITWKITAHGSQLIENTFPIEEVERFLEVSVSAKTSFVCS